ncbi:MAG: hypothetical protein AAFW01_13380 [Pseudomonadota bacterium]
MAARAYFFERRIRRWLAILALPVGLGLVAHQSGPFVNGVALLTSGVPVQARVLSLKVEDRDASWLVGKRHVARNSVLGGTVERSLGAERFETLREGMLTEVTVVPERPGAVDISSGQTLLDAAKGLLAGIVLTGAGLISLIVTWRRNTGRWRVSE